MAIAKRQPFVELTGTEVVEEMLRPHELEIEIDPRRPRELDGGHPVSKLKECRDRLNR